MPLSRKDTVAAVIVTHNRVELLEASLRQVANQEGAEVAHVVVVDNGNDPAVRELVEAVCASRGHYVGSATNLGGAGGLSLIHI